MNIVRQNKILEKVVFVGGLGGCGKMILTPIIGILDRVENQKYNYVVLDRLCRDYENHFM